MIKPLKISLVLTAICALILTACSKKETMEVDNETQSVVDYAMADQEFMGVISAALRSALMFTTTGVQNYTFVPTSYGMPDGRERSGSISVRRTAQAKDPGAQSIFRMVKYTAGGAAYTCDSIVGTTNESTSSYTTFRVKLVNGICETSGYTIKYSFDRTYTLYVTDTTFFADVVAHVYGAASGTNRNGRTFSATVFRDSPLVKRANCPYISSGAMELIPEGFKARTINFGEGVCDNEATFTVNENTVAFKLK